MTKPKQSQNHKWAKKGSKGSILIRFNYQHKTFRFAPVKAGRFDNPKDLAIANRVASEIEQSIKLGTFASLKPWKPKKLEEKIGIGDSNPYLLGEIWRDYKVANKTKVSEVSQKGRWLIVDTFLAYKGLGLLPPAKVNPQAVIKLLSEKWECSTIGASLAVLHAACNLAVRRKLIPENPLKGHKHELPNAIPSKRSKQAFTHDEAIAIIEAFKAHANENISHYANFVEFLFLTGVRPQLAIALTWADIKDDRIVLNKGFTKGVLTKGKTGRVTNYPLYPQLKELVEKVKTTRLFDMDRLESELVFPSINGGYIAGGFRKDVWIPMIKRLIDSKKVSRYLPPYNCRHTTASFLSKAGIPSSTIAVLLDTSEQMLNRHYFDSQELTNVAIPDLL